MAFKPQVLSAIDGGTGQASYTTGDILYASNSTTLSKLALGAAGQILSLSGGVPAWVTYSSVIDYVDAVLVATTASLNATYLNGVAGVGATLVNAGALAAFSVDGQTPAINSRVLVKNQGSTFQNGVYTLTTVGSGAVAWVLTRSLDYNTPSEINVGDVVPVQTGTANANTSWLQGATVATIGTDPITFTQFQSAPISTTQYDVLVGGANNSVASVGPGSAGQVLQSAGNASNPAYSTATYPATAGTSGKILISDGTNIVSSTPTFPNASATTGKIIQSDGTNWIASTPTLPATAGTSGNVLTSDGTNWLSSAASGSSAVTVVSGTLTSAQIKALHGTPVQIIAAPGNGNAIQLLSAVSTFAYGGTNQFAAAASQTISCYYGTTLQANNSTLVANTTITGTTAISNMTLGANLGNTARTNINNIAINLYNPIATEISGNAGNNNTINWSVAYITVPT